jgi:hypothetical protein
MNSHKQGSTWQADTTASHIAAGKSKASLKPVGMSEQKRTSWWQQLQLDRLPQMETTNLMEARNEKF